MAVMIVALPPLVVDEIAVSGTSSVDSAAL